MGKIIGIDLGTTKSAVAIFENGEPKIYQNLKGGRTTPSYVALKKTGEWIVGVAAKNQTAMNPLKTFYGVKRLIGRRFEEAEVAKMQALASYKIVKGPNGDAWVDVDGTPKAPVEISAMVLAELKKAVEAKLGEEVTQAVITVPAYFNNAQRQATKDAGKIAGLEVLRIVNEPTAAALAYGMNKMEDGKVAVFDLGGGTFDISILDLNMDEDGSVIKVVATNGDTFLGGENFDERITEFLIQKINEEYKDHGVNIDIHNAESKTKYAEAIQRIRQEAEKAKIALSQELTTEVSLPYLLQGTDGPINFTTDFTRQELEDLVRDLVEKTIEPCRKSLADAGLQASDLKDVILVGAQTRMPLVIETVKKFFGKEPRRDVTPDEIVAMGAACQAGILDVNSGLDNVLLLDVIPLSIGIKTANDGYQILVPKNSTIPCEHKDTFGTAEDNQSSVELVICQGERPKASQNHKLSESSLTGLPPGSKGTVKIDVTFKIDENGVLQVEAANAATGRKQNITVKANGGLSEADVARMLKEAEENREQDEVFTGTRTAAVLAKQELDAARKDVDQEYFVQAPADLKEIFTQTVEELTAAHAQAAAAKEAPTRELLNTLVEKTAALKQVRTDIGNAFNSAATPSNDNGGAEAPEASTEEGPAPAATGPAGP